MQYSDLLKFVGEGLRALERGVGAGVVGDGYAEAARKCAAQVVVQRSHAELELLLLVVDGDHDLDDRCGVSRTVRDIA
jgi:hypothetical protein